MSAPTVFISYSHRDKDLLPLLVAQLKALEQAGLLDVWVDTRIDAGEIWYPDIEQAMQRAAVAVCMVSEHFLASDFCVKEEVPFLLQRAEQDGLLIIPVLLSDCPWYAHRWVEERQMLPGEGESVRTNYAGDPAAVFSKVARRIYDKFQDPNFQPPKPHRKWPLLTSDRLDISHLPETGAALFGRDEELTLLDQVWAGNEQSSDGVPTRVLAFKAQGGVGKSTLINHWLAEMRRDQFRGATRVFGWSFYSQGVREQGAPSADTFVAAALRFFGDESMAASAASAWDKGERLARLVGAERALLVLDGMEPLQSAQTIQRGKLQDPAIESLLRGLARYSDGLCIITTREPLAELGKKAGIVERDLEQITPESGRALLRVSHVIGTDAELEALADRFGPHALAISLLGIYLHEQPGRGIEAAQELERMPGKSPLDRVLAGFEKMLAGSPEMETLRLLGFFDRPADEGCLRALREIPAIAGLTDKIVGMDETGWHRLLDRLEKLRLVHIHRGESGKRFVDTHPLIREHFGARVREQHPDAWRTAHRRLYEHLRDTSDEGEQPTLEDLQPLYQAVAHGCQAGLEQEVHDGIHAARIRQWNAYYSTRKLGAFGSDLGAIACFFNQPWNSPSTQLEDSDRAVLIAQAAFCLRALGRLTEAIEPMRAALKMEVQQEAWIKAAINASNLSQLELTLGEVSMAVSDAERSVIYADRSGDAFQRITKRISYADALHQANREREALQCFHDAEQMQKDYQPVFPLLYAVQGFWYCDLLLAAPERAAWREIYRPDVGGQRPELIEKCRVTSQRAAQTFEWVTGKGGPLEETLDYLTLGRAALYEVIVGQSDRRPLTLGLSNIDAAVDGLRRAGQQWFLPGGLLTRAWLRFLTDAHTGPESAQEDLDEAWEIAERGPMRLFMADIHLYRARLFGSQGSGAGSRGYPWNKNPDGSPRGPKDDLAAARKLIEQCGYWRRKEELEDAEEAAKNWK
jgi:tetratricopeptide (TPR) repeat protein